MSNLNIIRYMSDIAISEADLKNVVVENESLLSILAKAKNRINENQVRIKKTIST